MKTIIRFLLMTAGMIMTTSLSADRLSRLLDGFSETSCLEEGRDIKMMTRSLERRKKIIERNENLKSRMREAIGSLVEDVDNEKIEKGKRAIIGLNERIKTANKVYEKERGILSSFKKEVEKRCTLDTAAFETKKLRNYPNKNKKPTINEIKRLSDFSKANITWGKRLNPSGSVPAEGFYAYYLKDNKIIKKEVVDDISVNYSWDKFHGIKSQNFRAYWVGNFHVSKSGEKKIAIDHGRSNARLIIDGHVVYKGNAKKEIPLYLEKGKYRVEVEFINNWHTTDLSVAILDNIAKRTNTEIKEYLSTNVEGDYDVFFSGVYESKNKDMSVRLNVKDTNKNVVLLLSSYRKIKWVVSNPFKVNILAIVYGSYSPGTVVTGDVNKETILLQAKKSIGSYAVKKNCSCRSGYFHCSGGGSLLATSGSVKFITNKPLAGFSGEYAASELQVPSIVVDDAYLQALKKEEQENRQLAKACKRKNNPDFEKIMR